MMSSYFAIEETKYILEKFGPKESKGNPILDEPDGKFLKKKSNYINIPLIFNVCQSLSIFVAIWMFFNCIVFMWDSIRSKKMYQKDPTFADKDAVMRKMTCSGWLAGYCVFLVIVWLAIVSLVLIPIFDFVEVKRACQWMHNAPDQNKYMKKFIRLDMKQMGLVSLNWERIDETYGQFLYSYDDEHKDAGNLNMLCENYQSTFELFCASLGCSSICLVSLVLFAVLHAANFTHVKERRMHFVIMNGVTKSVVNNTQGYNTLMAPHHNATMHSQLTSMYDSMSYNQPMNIQVKDDMQSLKSRPFYPTRANSRASTRYRGLTSSKAPSVRTGRSGAFVNINPTNETAAFLLDNDQNSISAESSPKETSIGKNNFALSEVNYSDQPSPTARSTRKGDEVYIHGNYDTIRSFKSTRTAHRSLYKQKKDTSRAAQSDTNISRHLRRSNSRCSPKECRSYAIQDEYDSPPSDYYQQEDEMLRKQKAANNQVKKSAAYV